MTNHEDINIVATGSTGNFNVINNKIIIDMGVNRKMFKPYMANAELIMISHRHGDHISLPIVRMIYREFPGLLRRLYVNQNTWELINDADPKIAKEITHRLEPRGTFHVKLSDGEYSISTFPLVHDVENQGFIITTPRGNSIIHATDTETMKFAPSGTFDYLLVEGNWDEETLINKLLSTDKSESFRASRNLRHLSVQALCRFVAEHSHDNSVVHQLHESGEYGVRARDISAGALAAKLVN